MDQGTSHKTRDTETYRGESGEKPWRYGHRGKIPEQNIKYIYQKVYMHALERVWKMLSVRCASHFVENLSQIYEA